MRAGDTISHYRIVGQLGAGGMGVVYSAEDVRLGRPVALKFLADDLAHSQQAIDRLKLEARTASALNHPNICTIYDIDEHGGHPFIVMELMKGQSLRERLAGKPLKVHQLVDIGIQIADALDAAHSVGVLHRDIKPGNIFLTDRGQVKVLDFGLAKLTPLFGSSSNTTRTPDPTAAGVTLGTVAYMSPEQATGEELDGRTDLFSAGVVLYECATGRQPFTGKTSAVVLSAILNSAPIAPVALNPELPLRLEEVINNCLEKDRELRYQSAADLRADLKRVRRDIESGNSKAVDTLSKGSRSASAARAPGSSGTVAIGDTSARGRPAAAIIATAALVVAVVGGAAYVVWQRRPPGPVVAKQTTVFSDAAVQSRLALARSSLDARNYRAALAYSSEVLSIEPGQTEAAKIRDQARDMLARFDAAVADARTRLATGDAGGASRATETARQIDPSAPIVGDLGYQLSELRAKQAQAEDARRDRDRSVVGLTGAGRVARGGPTRAQAGALPPAAPPSGSTANAPAEPSRPRADAVPAPQPPPVDPPSTGAARPSPPAEPNPAPATPPPPAVPRAPEPKAEPSADTKTDKPSEDDDAAIRRLIANYGRAIETKDLAVFRAIKPNLSAAEERRLRDGFRDVNSQRVVLTILSITRRGDEATVAVRRHDTIQAGGRQQTVESQQTLRVSRVNGSWVITDIR